MMAISKAEMYCTKWRLIVETLVVNNSLGIIKVFTPTGAQIFFKKEY